jgi:hypothetical protein
MSASDAVCTAWRLHANELAAWASRNLVNRSDAFGRYLPLSQRNGTPAITDKTGLTLDHLTRHFTGAKPGHIIGLHAIGLENTCRWGVFDLDNHKGDPTQAELNVERAIAVERVAAKYDLRAAIEDSNGAGGFHIWFIFSEPVSTASLYNCLTHLRDECGIAAKEIEMFPKQSQLAGKHEFGNFLRLPGRHHDGRAHWSRYFVDGEYREGEAAVRYLLNSPLNNPASLAGFAPPAHNGTAPSVTPPVPSSSGSLGDGDGRHNMLVKAARIIWHPKLYTEAELFDMLQALNLRRCDPPLPAAELAAIAHWMATRTADDEVDQLSERYGVIQLNGQVLILDTHGDGSQGSRYALLRPDAFRTLLANRYVKPPGKSKQRLSDAWLGSKYRRHISSIVFDPTGAAPRDAFNLWRGFTVAPNEHGSWALLEDHLRENVCGGDVDRYNWVIAWLADIFRNPMRKAGTALVLRGKQGTGKTIVGQAFGHLLGPHYRRVSTPRYVTGNFNAHLEHVLLLQAEEAFFAGDKAMAGFLKDLITSDRMLIEPKYINSYEVPNVLRLLVTTNERWSVPAGDGERRFTILDVGDRRRRDGAYFEAMWEQLCDGGFGALLHFLLNHEYDQGMIRRVLVTDALHEQQDFSMPPEEAWWQGILVRGRLPGDAAGDGTSVNSEMFLDYIEHCKRIGVLHRQTEELLGRFLKRIAPFKKHEVRLDPESARRENRRSRQVREFPSLEECRRRFDEHTGRNHEWEEPWDWMPPEDLQGEEM